MTSTSRPAALRRWLRPLATALLCAATFGSAHAAYPEQPVKLVVGFPPGGGGDLYGRLIATAMGKTLGQTVIVDNRTGAGGNIAADQVAKAKPDGYTLLLAMSGNLAVAPAFRPQAIPYKVPDDFAPIGLILEAPHGLFVAQNSRFKTARELLDAAKAGQLSFASTGAGAAAHIGMEMVKQQAGVNMLHVPYRSGGLALQAILAKETSMGFVDSVTALPYLASGELRGLAVTSRARDPKAPNVPTLAESGLAGYHATNDFGFFAPAGTPPAIVAKLSEAAAAALKDPGVRGKLDAASIDVIGGSAEAFPAYLAAEGERWGALIRKRNIRAE